MRRKTPPSLCFSCRPPGRARGSAGASAKACDSLRCDLRRIQGKFILTLRFRMGVPNQSYLLDINSRMFQTLMFLQCHAAPLGVRGNGNNKGSVRTMACKTLAEISWKSLVKTLHSKHSMTKKPVGKSTQDDLEHLFTFIFSDEIPVKVFLCGQICLTALTANRQPPAREYCHVSRSSKTANIFCSKSDSTAHGQLSPLPPNDSSFDMAKTILVFFMCISIMSKKEHYTKREWDALRAPCFQFV